MGSPHQLLGCLLSSNEINDTINMDIASDEEGFEVIQFDLSRHPSARDGFARVYGPQNQRRQPHKLEPPSLGSHKFFMDSGGESLSQPRRNCSSQLH